jgi:quinol monooxygenase YgiN
MPYVRVIRYRWLPGHTTESARLAHALASSVAEQPGSRGVRVLSALDGGGEGLVVFEWETRDALNQHLTAASLERLAPWAVPLLHWRTDQAYEVLPGEARAGASTTPGVASLGPR